MIVGLMNWRKFYEIKKEFEEVFRDYPLNLQKDVEDLLVIARLFDPCGYIKGASIDGRVKVN